MNKLGSQYKDQNYIYVFHSQAVVDHIFTKGGPRFVVTNRPPILCNNPYGLVHYYPNNKIAWYTTTNSY